MERKDQILPSKEKNTFKSEDMECGICLALMVEPVKLPCGHYFCLLCIEKIQIYNPMTTACPFCKQEAKNFAMVIDTTKQEEIKMQNEEIYNSRLADIREIRFQNNKAFKLTLVYGNKYRNQTYPNNVLVHFWCCYVKFANQGEDISKYIDKVTFVLHETFKDPIHEVTKAPFQVAGRGWGYFNIPITIEWNPKLKMEKTKFDYMLAFYGEGDVRTMEVVVDKTLLDK